MASPGPSYKGMADERPWHPRLLPYAPCGYPLTLTLSHRERGWLLTISFPLSLCHSAPLPLLQLSSLDLLTGQNHLEGPE